jgi:phage anti-repressor protein
VIDLDDVWKWLGFNQKVKAVALLEKQFIIEKDYKLLLSQQGKQKKEGRGGHNKDTIMLNIKTFKMFCIKADTKKAQEIHDYFIKLEELMQIIVQEESDELKLQLENHIIQFETYKTNTNQEKEMLRENIILEQFPKNTQCIYYGVIDNKEGEDEDVIKYGHLLEPTVPVKPPSGNEDIMLRMMSS